MNTREIKVNIQQEQTLYDELMAAMIEHHEYNGCYIMMYSEHRADEGQMVGVFTLRVEE